MKEEEKRISLKELKWIKSPDFREKTADVMAVITSERFINFDFGSFDYEGRDPKTMAPTNPFINYHTRIKVEYNHFKDIVRILNDILKREEEKRSEKK